MSEVLWKFMDLYHSHDCLDIIDLKGIKINKQATEYYSAGNWTRQSYHRQFNTTDS